MYTKRQKKHKEAFAPHFLPEEDMKEVRRGYNLDKRFGQNIASAPESKRLFEKRVLGLTIFFGSLSATEKDRRLPRTNIVHSF